MFAGHETTMSMLTSALALFKQHPEVLSRIRGERDEVVGDSELRPEHLKQLEYLDCALKEVERVRPPISLTMRGVVQETHYKGYRLPVGTTILISSAASHRLPAYFRDPLRFDPDRFMPPRFEHRTTPYSLIGFGGGQRLCIGRAFSLMEMKVVLCLLLKDFDWVLKTCTPSMKYLPTAYPVCGLQGAIVPRA
jgi:cytochrome P450